MPRNQKENEPYRDIEPWISSKKLKLLNTPLGENEFWSVVEQNDSNNASNKKSY
ncbi:hypothetical protein [Beggiatoa leptomitoformis]|uniref:Uncharacterized protein n=1 Tax=Beggiatoa leptomitoformis TaxID=288004 RepID=A0A650GDR5_9GAMM|nr:hypothetical protein [Beggiatoa leptomitoformis]QGX03588.1 hypothetical protein AL038_18690 [Beggiatoa leptomitoformis]QGX04061.1 hypothetical protein BLE401_18530 [Beggiatoa leptomitoformis]